ncbi:MAG: DUF6285 domain-containing protein [Alphaproteobacteria bacterium]
MAMDRPTAAELVSATRDFLTDKIAPELSGFNAFQLRIATNVLAIVERELEIYPDSESQERAILQTLTGTNNDDVKLLERELAQKIRDRDVTLKTDGLKDYLWQSVMTKLAIDQPRYARYRAVKDS